MSGENYESPLKLRIWVL